MGMASAADMEVNTLVRVNSLLFLWLPDMWSSVVNCRVVWCCGHVVVVVVVNKFFQSILNISILVVVNILWFSCLMAKIPCLLHLVAVGEC